MSRSFTRSIKDIHKKLQIVRSIKDLDIDYSTRSTGCRNKLVLTDPATKKAAAGSEIPTPQYVVVESYERNYPPTFVQPPFYIQGRQFSESAEVCDSYNLDNDDENWLSQFNNERRVLSAEKFEMMLYKLEILDHKAAEKQAWTSTASVLGSPIPVVLSRDLAIELLKEVVMNKPAEVLGAVYDYWKSKREMWQKPILRRLQPPPAANDHTNPFTVFRSTEQIRRPRTAANDHTNPFTVFRPTEQIRRPRSTRRTRRRRKNHTVQYYEKLRQVRYDIEETLVLLRLMEQSEEKLREIVEKESALQLKTIQHAQYSQ